MARTSAFVPFCGAMASPTHWHQCVEKWNCCFVSRKGGVSSSIKAEKLSHEKTNFHLMPASNCLISEAILHTNWWLCPWFHEQWIFEKHLQKLWAMWSPQNPHELECAVCASPTFWTPFVTQSILVLDPATETKRKTQELTKKWILHACPFLLIMANCAFLRSQGSLYAENVNKLHYAAR